MQVRDGVQFNPAGGASFSALANAVVTRIATSFQGTSATSLQAMLAPDGSG